MKNDIAIAVESTTEKNLLSSEQPFVSVVIPMFNERDNISVCLDSLFAQDYPIEKTEICVVDGASTDGSGELVQKYAAVHPNVKLLSNPGRITPKGLNIGVKAAGGEVVIILGAHTKVERDFITKNIRHMRQQSVPCVGGTQINRGESYMQQAIGFAMGSPFGIMSAPYRYRRSAGFVDTVVYAAYHRSLFDEVGYFEEEKIISEDAELNWRIRKAGHKIYFSPDIVSYYLPRKNLLKLAKQFFRYGIFRVNVVKKHIDALKLLHLIPPVFVLSLLITGVFSIFSAGMKPFFWVLLLIYALFLTVAALTTASRSGWKYLPVLPPAFMMMQLSFGFGFLVGLFKSHH